MMEKTYEASAVEERLYAIWEGEGYFKPRPSSGGEDPYVIVIPPPNVTGILHMGHVLNNTLQDILIRWHRMRGRETVWMPGCDHAGIATQNVVAKKLREAGKDPREMGREAFVEEVWRWKDHYHDRITGQLKRLGCSLDWDRERFTMDDGLSTAVQKVFIELFDAGLIYRGHYIVNWDPMYQTALSDEEVEFRDIAGKLWHLRYPMADGDGYLVVATTRPETMLGDTAVAISPKDESKAAFRGKRCILPLVDRELPIIEDDFVDPEFGSGFVKVTPAHDPNDFEMGKRHELEQVVVIAPDGTMNERAGEFAGLDRYEARKRIIAKLGELGLVDKIEDYAHSVGHGDRSGVAIEPYLSEQWFVKMKPLAEAAIKAVQDGDITLTPPRWEKTYMHWMDNIRDWCISRQLWWGHRIPVWTNTETGELRATIDAPSEGGKWRQEEDVLDTWFSSWLWPFSIQGWPAETEELKRFYPSGDLITAPEILFFWVARMIMAGYRFADGKPFSRVFLHGIIRDQQGRKMSKSLGNSPDPIDLFNSYGVDAVRFSMTMLTPFGGDYLFENSHMEMGRNFANKLWNASRYVLGQIEKLELEFDGCIGGGGGSASGNDLADWMALEWMPASEGLLGESTQEDRWILSRLQACTENVNKNLDLFRFNDAARAIYDFLWKEYCDWYLELTKIRVYGEDKQAAATALITAGAVLHSILRLLHPFMPYVTEAIWERFPGATDRIIVASFPNPPAAFHDESAESAVGSWMEIISAVRGLRKELELAPSKEVTLIFRTSDDERSVGLESCRPFLRSLAKVSDFNVEAPADEKPDPASAVFLPGLEIWLPLDGLVDLEEERARLEKEHAKVSQELKGLEAKLANAGFTEKAPPAVVQKTRDRCEQGKEKAAELIASIAKLRGTD